MTASQRTIHLDLSGITIRIDGEDDGVLDLFETFWPDWISSPADRPDLAVRYRAEGQPPAQTTRLDKILDADIQQDQASFITGEGRIVVRADGSADATVLEGYKEFRFFGLQNLLLAALTWILPLRDALVLHGAGIILDGSAVLLIGPENSGKTTWAGLAREAGVAPVSDDLLFVDCAGEHPCVLGSPFRADTLQPCGPGRWPVALFLTPKHASEAELLDCSLLAFQAILAANLPFAAGQLGSGGPLDRLLDRLPGMAGFRTLAFAKDPTFLPVLRTWVNDRKKP
jgi:hypothetical protein